MNSNVRPKKLPIKVFKKIYSRVPRLCVDLVISDRRGILLAFRQIQPWKGLWHLPGGTVFFGESLKQAAKRIAREETGLKIRIIKDLGYIEFLEEIKLANRHSVSIALLCRPLGGQARGSWQGEKIQFFKAMPKPIIPRHRQLLNKL